MKRHVDFVEWNEVAVNKLLTSHRDLMGGAAAPADGTRRSVVLVAMDGAASHKRHHHNMGTHYRDFSAMCRRVLTEYGGAVCQTDLHAELDYVVCGWFPANGIDAIIAVAALQHQLLRSVSQYRPPWCHERHPTAGIGSTEFAAFRMLQFAGRDQAMVDPVIWDRLPDAFRQLAECQMICSPDCEKIAEDVNFAVSSSVDWFFEKVNGIKQAEQVPAT
jgi:hypothetical protein